MGKQLIAQVLNQPYVKQWTKTQQQETQSIKKNPINNEQRPNQEG